MITNKKLNELIKKWGPKQVESFWINSIIELTKFQRKILGKEMEKIGKIKKFQ